MTCLYLYNVQKAQITSGSESFKNFIYMILTYFLWCRPPGDISSGAHISLSAPFFYTESFQWICVQHVAQNGQWNTVKIRSDKTLSTRQVLKSTSLCLCENFPKRAVTRQQWRMRLKTEKLNLRKQSVDLSRLLVRIRETICTIV